MKRKAVRCLEREHCFLLPHCYSSVSVIQPSQQPAHYCVSLNQGSVSLSNVQAPVLQCYCSMAASSSVSQRPLSSLFVGTFLLAKTVNENRLFGNDVRNTVNTVGLATCRVAG